MTVLIPHEKLIEKLTVLASATGEHELDHAFWAEDHPLGWALKDGVGALLELARELRVGIMLNLGWRCDVPFEKVGIEVCDNTPGRRKVHFELQAVTVPGAIAAGILAVLEARDRDAAPQGG